MAKTVVGLFDNQSEAQAALRDLQQAGFDSSNINMVNQASAKYSSMLVNAGIPEQDAAIYADGVQNGGALVILQALSDSDAPRAADILDRHNVIDISRRGKNYDRTLTTRDTTRTGMTNLYQGGETVLPVIEEELIVGKREVETGGVRVNTRVEEVPVQEQVTLRDEEVHIDRQRVDRPLTDADAAFVDQSFEVRETDEEAVVAKQARVVEEVVIDKDVRERTETISDTVRRQDVEVQEVAGNTTTTGTNYTTSASTTGTTGTTGGQQEGFLERAKESLESGAEKLTGKDLNKSGDVGDRDVRNNY